MKTITYTELPNGMCCLSTQGKQMEIITEISQTEFEKKFPNISTYGLEQYSPIYLENGKICIDKEWNGERYILDDNTEIVPVYKQNSENDFEIIGYKEI